ncbi:MAG: hypothetical protein ACR2N3_14235 [Pyrinomonadaceae bacterium]
MSFVTFIKQFCPVTYSHQLTNKSQIGIRAMMSLDPIIERGYGYPLLYQSGEVYKNQSTL